MAAPDFAVLTRGLTETNRVLQELTNAQQSVSGEIVKFENIPGVQRVQLTQILNGINEILGSVNNLREDFRQLQSVTSARDTNVYSRLENQNASQAHFRLSTLYSVSLEQAYLQQLNQPIPNFPTTVRMLRRLSRGRCNAILQALNIRLAPVQEEDDTALRRRVARAIGIVRDIFD